MSNKVLPGVFAIIAVATLIWLIQSTEELNRDSTGETAQIYDIAKFGDSEIADESRTEDWLA